MKKITLLFILLTVSFGFSQNLVTNGDFQTGTVAPWYNNAANAVDIGGGNFVNQANVTAVGNPWDVNLSQDVDLLDGKTYELSFDAYTDATTATRTMLAGIGQNGPGWANLTQTPILTATSQTFTYQFTVNYGNTVGDRVFFDMGAATGFVFIDNVSVQEVVNTCINGVQDGDETGVDCGGSCPNACSVPSNSNYCSTQVFHLDIPAEVNSAINLTIVNTGANTMKVTAAAADITFLDLVGALTGAPTVSASDTSVSGEISKTLTWSGTPPTNVTIQYIQWRKTSTGGATWQKNDATTPFTGVCAGPEAITTLSDLKLDGATITGFGAAKTVYNIEVSSGAAVPQITSATTTNPAATVGPFTQATALPGTATFNVTSENTLVVQAYTINYVILAPQVAAPTPPARAAADVVSIYSDAPYTSVTPINLDAGWCNGGNPGAVTATTAGGNAVLAYNDKACQGINFDSALQNFTGITHLHVDLFIKSGTNLVGKVFNIKIVPSSGAESVFPIDINGISPKPVPGTWYSYDVPITISGPTVNIKEVGITSNFVNAVYYDNLYFHKNTTLGTKDYAIAGLQVYPNPAQDNWTIITQNIKMSTIQVYDILGKNVLSISPNAVEAKINASSLKAGLYFAKINTANGSSSIKLVKE